MIPVHLAPEPSDFDVTIRQPGLAAVAELVGEAAARKRRGPRRKVRASRREELKPKDFPTFWRLATKDLMEAYNHICAFSCLYIEWTTGAATVDHWAPKSKAWDRVYEWDNYRLACLSMNARKCALSDVIDPFDITEGMFALDLITLKAIPGPNAGSRREVVGRAIRLLKLDSADYSEDLGEYYHCYMKGEIKLGYLQRRAPFLARELRRQGKLLPGDE
jgi:hypothetical protein